MNSLQHSKAKRILEIASYDPFNIWWVYPCVKLILLELQSLFINVYISAQLQLNIKWNQGKGYN